MTYSTSPSRPAKLLLSAVLLLAALAMLLCRPALSSAKSARSACSPASAHAKRHVHACAGHARSGRSHGKARGRRSGHRRHPIHKKKGKANRHGSGQAPVPPASGSEWSEAECEDGSAPERADDGSFVCEDGSQPACANGSTPRLSDDGSMLVCFVHGTSPPPSGEEAEEDAEGEAEDNGESAAAATGS